MARSHHVKIVVGLAIAAASLAGAHAAREGARQVDVERAEVAPYAPSPAAAPILSGGYRELAADLFFVRLAGYFGGSGHTPEGLAALAEAIVALDPHYRRIYLWGAGAISAANTPRRETLLRAIALLEAGARVFPDDWRMPNLAGQIYIADLQTDDPAQRRAWDDRGTRLLEAATRKPGAPASLAESIAILRTRLGQRERAVEGLRELLLITTDTKAREQIIKKLAELEDRDADLIAGEILEARRRFEAAHARDRPAVTPSLYLLLGPPLQPGFDLADLATGGRDIVVVEPTEPLEPLE